MIITSKTANRIDSKVVNDYLDTVNGKSITHTVRHFRDVLHVAYRAENRLEMSGVPVKNRAGVTVTYRSALSLPRGYKYSVTTTKLHLRRVHDGWRLVAAEKVEVGPQTPEAFTIHVSTEVRDIIVNHALEGYKS